MPFYLFLYMFLLYADAFTPFNILDALNSIKCGKSSGVDGIFTEHFVFAYNHIHVLLSL